MWDREEIFKIVSVASSPLFLADWTESLTRRWYAKVCVLMDITKVLYLCARIKVMDMLIWKQFNHEELLDLCYSYGCLGRTLESCGCAKI